MTIDNINEKIIFKSLAKPQKCSKQIGRWLLVLLILGLLFYFYTLGHLTGLLNFLLLLTFAVLFIAVLYGLVYNFFIHDSKNKNYLYLLTEQHIIIAKDSIIIKNEKIINFKMIQICREKNNYGDVILFKVNYNNIANNLFPKQNKIELLGVESPRELVNLIHNINHDIYVFDDKFKKSSKNEEV